MLGGALLAHVAAWCLTFVMGERHTIPFAWVTQVALWVFLPAALVRAATHGRAVARWAFATILLFLAAGHGYGALAWLQQPAAAEADQQFMLVSAVLAASYAVLAGLIGFSPAVSRAVAAGRRGRH
jgi:hypothetical protein